MHPLRLSVIDFEYCKADHSITSGRLVRVLMIFRGMSLRLHVPVRRPRNAEKPVDWQARLMPNPATYFEKPLGGPLGPAHHPERRRAWQSVS